MVILFQSALDVPLTRTINDSSQNELIGGHIASVITFQDHVYRFAVWSQNGHGLAENCRTAIAVDGAKASETFYIGRRPSCGTFRLRRSVGMSGSIPRHRLRIGRTAGSWW
jgi:hypothetical protein